MKLVFEWDESKAEENLKKHRVSFVEASTLFDDPFLVSFRDDAHSKDEERYLSIGLSAAGKVLLVAHTDRERQQTRMIRIISCRRATPWERKSYEENPWY